MMNLPRSIWLAPLFVPLAGCDLTPDRYETPPVAVETAQGTVTCQLYSDRYVLWDRAIDWPKTLSAAQADAICKREGNQMMTEREQLS